MSDPVCIFISYEELQRLVHWLFLVAVCTPFVWVVLTTDWWFWIDLLRVWARRRRIRAIREARRG